MLNYYFIYSLELFIDKLDNYLKIFTKKCRTIENLHAPLLRLQFTSLNPRLTAWIKGYASVYVKCRLITFANPRHDNEVHANVIRALRPHRGRP